LTFISDSYLGGSSRNTIKDVRCKLSRFSDMWHRLVRWISTTKYVRS